jgi:hypothetical protein
VSSEWQNRIVKMNFLIYAFAAASDSFLGDFCESAVINS